MKAIVSFLFFCFVFGCGSKDDKPTPVNTADTTLAPVQPDAGPLDTNNTANSSQIALDSAIGPKKKR